MERNRRCDRCGKVYYRSNRLRLWPKTNPGHRRGWERVEVKLCTACMSASAASQANRLVSARIVSIDMRKKAS